MLAALITGAGQVELREFPDPTPAPTGVVVDVAYCGICGTDIHAYQSGRSYNPAICGHEWTGTVSATGAEVTGVGDGDKVVVGVPPACGTCDPCRAGHVEHCATTFAFAVGRDAGAPPHGGFARRIAVDARRVLPAHLALTDPQLAQVEPVTVTFHAVRRSGIRHGDTAVVQGAGAIGLTTLQCVRAAGAGDLIVIEPDPRRGAIAAAHGATVVTPGEARDQVMERTGGLGADIVYECVGRPETIQSAVDLARRGGSMCLIGLADGDATITPGEWLRKEITVTSALAYLHEEFEMAMDLMATGDIVVDDLHTTTIGLEGFAATMADLAAGGSEQIKVLVDPTT